MSKGLRSVRAAATDGVVNIPISRRANRTVIAVLVDSEQRVIQRPGALFDLPHGPKLRNGLACPRDDNSLAALYSTNEAREVRVRIGDIDSFVAHTCSLANRGELIKLAWSGNCPVCADWRRVEPSAPDGGCWRDGREYATRNLTDVASAEVILHQFRDSPGRPGAGRQPWRIRHA